MKTVILVVILHGMLGRLPAEHRAGLGSTGLGPNVPLPTLGGRQWWGDVAIWTDWRIQQHAVTGHARVLDHHGIRRAWGSLEACHAFVADHQPTPLSGDLVIFLHGLGRTRRMWHPLARDVQAVGWTPVAVTWPSTREDLPPAAARLRTLLVQLSQSPEVTSLRFITHSQGGILLRFALAEPVPYIKPILGTIFCFPPHQGAYLAAAMLKWSDIRPDRKVKNQQAPKKSPQVDTRLGSPLSAVARTENEPDPVASIEKQAPAHDNAERILPSPSSIIRPGHCGEWRSQGGPKFGAGVGLWRPTLVNLVPWRWPLLILGPGLRRITPQRARDIPPWNSGRALVIAGGRGNGWGLNPWIPGDDDGVVAVTETYLPGTEHCVLPVTHTFGVRNAELRHTVVSWLQSEAAVGP